ncbi:MAG: AMP-binding protein [Rhodospirillales bacterium]|nr:AMP-binding protein [Rhodospirillales bacterium]
MKESLRGGVERVSHVAPMRALNRPKPTVDVERRTDGTLILSADRSLPADLPLVIDLLQRAAERRPQVTFLAERRGPDRRWHRLSYAEAWARTGAIASWLIAQGFGPDGKPIAILSDNSLENALLVFGALRAGVLVAPISPNYSLSGDFTRLDRALSVVEPGLVFAQDSVRYAGALDRARTRIVTVDGKRGLAFGALAACSIDASVSERRLHIAAGTPAKILFTSGSTGLPRGVLNIHGNLAAAAEMNRSLGEPLDENRIGVSLDWLPWHHAWGGNSNLNGVIRSAGSLYIDGGRPVPGRFQETLENLRELSPTSFATVPAAYPLLLEALERDEDLRQKFFKNLRGLGYGGALLPQESFDRLQSLAAGQLGERLPFSCGWGMTETTSVGLMVYWNVDRSGLLGLPPPGALVKLVPAGSESSGPRASSALMSALEARGPEEHDDRYELRVKGPHVMAGYYKDPGGTAAAFDSEGFFKTGDAARWVDETNPVAGIAFAGRLSEEFKLASGTWVRATTLRTQLIDALQPYVRDLLIAAPDRPYLGALIWLDAMACADAGGPVVWKPALSRLLAAFNGRPAASGGGSSNRVLRLLVLDEPPSVAEGEVTDKRSLNTRRVLDRRSADVARLYAEPADRDVILARVA